MDIIIIILVVIGFVVKTIFDKRHFDALTAENRALQTHIDVLKEKIISYSELESKMNIFLKLNEKDKEELKKNYEKATGSQKQEIKELIEERGRISKKYQELIKLVAPIAKQLYQLMAERQHANARKEALMRRFRKQAHPSKAENIKGKI